MTNAFSKDDIVRALGLLWRDRTSPIEVRILAEKGIHSGYYDNVQGVVTAAECWNGEGNIYVTLNKVDPDCAARCLNKLRWTKRGETTKDQEIVGRLNIYIDCDPRRITGIASTAEEHAASYDVACAVRAFLRERGLPETALISSGNGHGLFLAIDSPADDGGLVKKFLEALAKRFDNGQVDVDTSVFNASRIARLPGTINCKGENLKERPHRLARIIEAPNMLVPATTEQLQVVIDAIIGTQPASDSIQPQQRSEHFDVGGWLARLGVGHTMTEKRDGIQYNLDVCPFKCDPQPAGGCAILQRQDGSIVASCFHKKCKDKGWGWKELRAQLDPTFEARAEAAAVPGWEGVRDPHRLARLVRQQFAHPEHDTILLFKGFYFTWKDGVWEEQRLEDVRRVITRCVKAEFDRYAAARARHGADSQTPQVTTAVVNNVLNALSSMIEVTALDGPGWLSGDGWQIDEILVCKSAIVHVVGHIDGKADITIPHTSRLFVMNKLDFDFDPAAPAPERWLQFLNEVWPNEADSQKLLQEYVGYCLTPDVGYQKFLALIGKTRGGKGTITRMLMGLIGKENYCATRLSQMAGRFGLENAVDKSLIIVPDARMPKPDKAAEVVELIKAIVGNDPIGIDRKGRPVITLSLLAKLIIASNEMLGFSDESSAIYNRMLVLRFTNTFLGKEDTELDSKLRAEIPGVLLWAIEGLKRLREQGRFTEPRSGLLLKRQLQASGSPVASFVNDCCVVDPKTRVGTDDLYLAFETYCDELQIKKCEKPEFGKQLVEAVPAVDLYRPRSKDESGKRPRYYSGIALRPTSIDTALAPANDGGETPFDDDANWCVRRELPPAKRDMANADTGANAV